MAKKFDIRHRSDTAANWTAANPTLALGELGYEYDTGLFKIGTGAALWAALSYAAITQANGDTRYVLASNRGIANGVATLDGTGKIPAGQLPSLRLVSVSTVANQAARLALAADDDAQFVVQSDIAATFVLPAGADPTANGNWVQLPQPSTAGLQATSGKDAANGYAGLDAAGLLKQAEFPVIDGGTA